LTKERQRISMFLWSHLDVIGLDFLSRPFRIYYNGIIIHLYDFGIHKGAIEMSIIIDIMFLSAMPLKKGAAREFEPLYAGRAREVW